MSDSILNFSRGLSVLVLCVETYWIHIKKNTEKIKKSDVIYSETPRLPGWICTPLSRAWTWSSLKSNLFWTLLKLKLKDHERSTLPPTCSKSRYVARWPLVILWILLLRLTAPTVKVEEVSNKKVEVTLCANGPASISHHDLVFSRESPAPKYVPSQDFTFNWPPKYSQYRFSPTLQIHSLTQLFQAAIAHGFGFGSKFSGGKFHAAVRGQLNLEGPPVVADSCQGWDSKERIQNEH